MAASFAFAGLEGFSLCQHEYEHTKQNSAQRKENAVVQTVDWSRKLAELTCELRIQASNVVMGTDHSEQIPNPIVIVF